MDLKLGDKTFVIEWLAGTCINCITLQSQIQFYRNKLAEW